ncbi:hypothetical protein D0Y65_054620, partial [Glycine soja]
RWLGFAMVQHNEVQQHYLLHGLLFRVGASQGMLFASVYGLWLLRNKVVFQNVISDVYGMLSHIRRISWIWLYRVPFSGSGGVVFGNWCICPLDCLRCVC